MVGLLDLLDALGLGTGTPSSDAIASPSNNAKITSAPLPVDDPTLSPTVPSAVSPATPSAPVAPLGILNDPSAVGGTDYNSILGMLGDSPSQKMINLGLGLMNAGGYSRTPKTFGQSLAEGNQYAQNQNKEDAALKLTQAQTAGQLRNAMYPDLQKVADQALLKVNMGIAPSPIEMAALKSQDSLNQSKLNYTQDSKTGQWVANPAARSLLTGIDPSLTGGATVPPVPPAGGAQPQIQPQPLNQGSIQIPQKPVYQPQGGAIPIDGSQPAVTITGGNNVMPDPRPALPNFQTPPVTIPAVSGTNDLTPNVSSNQATLDAVGKGTGDLINNQNLLNQKRPAISAALTDIQNFIPQVGEDNLKPIANSNSGVLFGYGPSYADIAKQRGSTGQENLDILNSKIAGAKELIKGAVAGTGDNGKWTDSDTKNLDAMFPPPSSGSKPLLSAVSNLQQKYGVPPQPASGGLPQISSPSDPAFVALPPGSKFIDPSTGQTMVKH